MQGGKFTDGGVLSGKNPKGSGKFRAPWRFDATQSFFEGKGKWASYGHTLVYFTGLLGQ